MQESQRTKSRSGAGVLVLWLLSLMVLGSTAQAQTVTVLFDEDDAIGVDYREASSGSAEGGDTLTLTGPNSDKMPVVTASAFQGSTSGLLEYSHTSGGAWMLDIAAEDFGTVDLSEADSLVFYLNAPMPVAGPALPRFALGDANGRTTALLDVDPGSLFGFDASRTGFVEGSMTNIALQVEYIEALPADQVRPGYPEDLQITFSDAIVDTSRAAIGVPAIPAKFTVETVFSDLELAFSFMDLDGDSTLSRVDEYIDILTPEEAGSTRLRSTWRVMVRNTPGSPPGAGDVYLLAAGNGGIDGDPDTWQRIGVAINDFGPLGNFDLSQTQFIRFVNGEQATDQRTLWVDSVVGIDRGATATGPPPPVFTVQPGDSSVVLRWDAVPGAAATHVYRQVVPEVPVETVFEKLTDVPTTVPHFADLDAQNGQAYTYILRSVDVDGVQGPDSEPVSEVPQAGLSDAFLDLLQETAFAFFWEEANPNNGLIRDRSRLTSASSIAAVGFGLSAITVAIDKGWITREAGRERVLTTLRYFATCPQDGASAGSCGYRGFFYHFLNMETGLRAGTTELSTIDTALLLGGVLDAGVYFDGEHEDEGRIRSLAETIYERVEWDWASPRAPLVSHGWRPESGFIGNDWNGYNEAMILYILALGSPTFPMPPASWEAWTSGYGNQWGTFYGYTYLSFPPLFGHQYSHVWIDFRDIHDAYMRTRGIDYFENSRRATLANRAYAIANPNRYPNYGPNEWGLTASDDPFGYRAHGAPPPQSDNGTITPTAAGGSYAFTPEESAIAMRTFYRRYRAELWGEYGFRDAYNIRENWFATDVLGIDQGPILLMIENGRTEAIWERFMTIEAIQQGLEQAGFEGPIIEDVEPESEIPSEPVLLGSYPNPFSEHTAIHFTLPQPAVVTLTVYDVRGRAVATLVDDHLPAGTHTAPVDGTAWPSGVYFYTLRVGDVVERGSLLRIR
jgi:hypothetical protein